MTFDALAVHAIRDELQDRIEGGHIDDVRLIDERRVALDVFAAGRLTLVYAMIPSDPRIYLTRSRVRRGTDTVTPFLLLLRKYVRGSRIAAIAQPRLERVLILRLISHPENGVREVLLVAEAIGRRTNLILVDEDESIMDALVRLPVAISPGRPILPHVRYVAPPREPKLDPLDSAIAVALECAAPTADGAAWSLLVRLVDGLSPLAAREVIVRAGLDVRLAAQEVSSWRAVADALHGLMTLIDSGEWEPSVAWEDDRVRGFAPYRLRQFADATIQPYETMSEVVEVTAAAPTASAPRTILKQPLQDAITARLEQLRRKRGSLERSLASADRADDLREAGEAILANATNIESGATSLEFNGRRIDLYPTLSPSENAQAYFREYTAARDARKNVPPLLDEVASEIDHMAEMAVHVSLAERDDEIKALRGELVEAGVHMQERKPGGRAKPQKPQKKKKEGGEKGAYRRETVAGAEVLVGRSAIGNETVTFRLAGADDLWFHTRGIPGAHVVLRTEGKPQPEERIEAVAKLAARQSAARDESRVPVDYTFKRYVRRIPGAAPGRVTYREESTVFVNPNTASDED